MANTFKNAKQIGVTTRTDVYTAPVGKDSIILELDISNTVSSSVTTSVEMFDSTDSSYAYIVKDAPILVGSSLQVISGQKVILESGDKVCVTSSAAVDVVCSILEDVN